MPMIQNIAKLSGRLFSVADVADVCSIQSASARVLCSRYVKRGDFIRLKNNLYMLKNEWESRASSTASLFNLANQIQVPSYISFVSALSWWEITNQIPRDLVESAGVKRSFTRKIGDMEFRYSKLQSSLYFGYIKQQNMFIAKPEKALADSVYLLSLGRYAMDMSAVDWYNLDLTNFHNILSQYPQRTQQWWEHHGPV